MKNPFEGVFKKSTPEPPEEGLTMPKEEHEGYAEVWIEYQGDKSLLKVKQSLYNRFVETAKQRNCDPDDLLRAGLDRYGFGTDVFEKVINEK